MRLEADVATERMTYAFRASPIANLVYQLDCISHYSRCSRDAFEDLWTKIGMDDADRASLATWRELHERYHGAIESKADAADLPTLGAQLGLGGRLRIAGLVARDEADLLSRLALFVTDADVERARLVLERFEPRFEKFWETRKADLAAQVADFERVMNRRDVRALVDEIATFYEPELAPHTRLTIELVARPAHDSSDRGEQIGSVSVVEVLPNASAVSRLDVILHEAFHFWMGTMAASKQATLARAFLETNDRAALPAYGLLDEALAAAFGQGMVMRLVARDDFDKRMKKARGLYGDDAIDAAAKAVLPLLDARVASHGTLLDPDFVGAYVHAVAVAIPKLAPRLFLTPMVSLYDPALKHAEFHLYDVVRAGHTVSDDEFGREGLKLLHDHAAWATVFAVRPETIDSLAAVPDYVDARTLKTLRAEAKHPPFVQTIERTKAGPVFVMVSKDDAQMMSLDESFAARDEIVVGVWRP
jgi:hypothetical protein